MYEWYKSAGWCDKHNRFDGREKPDCKFGVDASETLRKFYSASSAEERLRVEDREPIPHTIPKVRPLNEIIKGPPTKNYDTAAERCGAGIEICEEGCRNFGIAKR